MENCSTSLKQARKKYKSNFLEKLFSILQDGKFKPTIYWNEDSRSFVIPKPSEFAKVILPMFFKHNKFNSFTRQLNMYNFTRFQSRKGYLSFVHPLFMKDRRNLIESIVRKRVITKSSAQAMHEDSEESSLLSEVNDELDSEYPYQASKFIKGNDDTRISQSLELDNKTLSNRSRNSNEDRYLNEPVYGMADFVEEREKSSRLAPVEFQSVEVRQAMDLVNQYERGNYRPSEFENFRTGLELFLNFEEIDRECENKYNELKKNIL